MVVRDHTSQVRVFLFKSVHSSSTHHSVEVAFVGKAPGSYSMLLGGGYYGQRLNKIYRGSFTIVHIPLLHHNSVPV
jgi:sulfite reductase beta subunit-like hemoprotein